jgi:carbon-monoxide dehydrogenase medium subunit
MKPAHFIYHRATSIEDAVTHLGVTDALVRPLAGGQSLVPMLNLRLVPVDILVDLTRVEALKRVEQNADGVRYGALLTHAAFEDRAVPDVSNGLMPFVGSQIAYRAVRTRGTIGGAIALADPAADWLTTIIALESSVALVGPRGRRILAATEFVIGPYMTALDDGEIIEAIVVPHRPNTERWGHYKMARKTGEYAESMAIALIDKSLGTARLVVGAADGVPLVLGKSAREVASGKTGKNLASIIHQELVDSAREFSSAKLHLHRTVSLRAIQNASTS